MKWRVGAGVILPCSLMLLSCAGFGQVKPVAQLTVQVRTEEAKPVEGVVVGVSTFLGWDSGDNFGRRKDAVVQNQTDSNGEAVISLPSPTGEIAYRVQDVPGYYQDEAGRIRLGNAVDGRWQPWNSTVKIVLKKKLNPIPLFARRVEVYEGKVASALLATNSVSFDLVKGDWLPPNGKGEIPDFVFMLQQAIEGMTADRLLIIDRTFTVRFSNKCDGIQSILADPRSGSSLRLPRMAPVDGYATNLVQRFRQDGYGRQGDEPRTDQNYFFRVRTKVDDSGKVVSALYGKIHGDFECGLQGQLRFTYYLNPTPNDRNLEFDPSRNLFKSLSSLENVAEP